MAQGPRHLRDSFASTGVRFTEQTLSAAQKAQAQANIGALPVGEQVSLALTTPVIDGVTYSALNDRQIVTVTVPIVGGSATDTIPLFQFPADAIILRFLLNITTLSSGVADLNIGYTPTSATTSANNLLATIAANAEATVFDSMNALFESGANAKAQLAASGKWITLTPTDDTTGLIATAYIFYILA